MKFAHCGIWPSPLVRDIVYDFSYHHNHTSWWQFLEGILCPFIKIFSIHVGMIIEIALRWRKNFNKKCKRIQILLRNGTFFRIHTFVPFLEKPFSLPEKFSIMKSTWICCETKMIMVGVSPKNEIDLLLCEMIYGYWVPLCSRNFQNVKLRLDFVEIWWFYCQSDFAWKFQF